MNNNIFRIGIDITNYCNFNCPYCVLDIPYKNIHPCNISISDIKCIVMYINMLFVNRNKPKIYQYAIDFCVRGGEPTLHNEFDKIINELYHIKLLNRLILLTNGSIPFNYYNIDYSVFNELRISIHIDILKREPHYLKIIINNIVFLLKHKIIPIIYIMKSNNVSNSELNYYIYIINSLYINYNASVKNINIIDVFPTKNYINTKYDYTKINSIYNQKYKKPVYYRRSIKISTDMTCHYSCELASKINIPINSVYSIKTWKYLYRHLNEQIICELPTCTCPIFCYK